MKGLIKNNLYGAIGNIKLFFVFDVLLSIILLLTGEPSVLNIFAVITAPAMALLAISCLRKEETSKWSKYKLTFPIMRNDIVKSQFISHIFWTVLGVIWVGIIITLTVLVHGNRFFAYGFRDAITIVLCGGVVAALLGAIAYPMLYLWGAERTEAVLAISVVSSIGILFGLTWLINVLFPTNPISDIKYYISMAIIFIITVVLCIISYFLTTTIINKKEY